MQTKHISGKTFHTSPSAEANSGQTFPISSKAQANSILAKRFSNQTLTISGKADPTLTKTEAISTATLANSTQTFDNYPVAIAFIAAAAEQVFSSTDSSYPTINIYSLTVLFFDKLNDHLLWLVPMNIGREGELSESFFFSSSG